MLVVLVLWDCWRGRGRKDEKTRCNWGAKSSTPDVDGNVKSQRGVRWSGRPSCFHCFGTPKSNFFGVNMDIFVQRHAKYSIDSIWYTYWLCLHCLYKMLEVSTWDLMSHMLLEWFLSFKEGGRDENQKIESRKLSFWKCDEVFSFPGCLGFMGDEILPSQNGEYKKPWHSVSDTRIPIKQPVFNGKYPLVFFPVCQKSCCYHQEVHPSSRWARRVTSHVQCGFLLSTWSRLRSLCHQCSTLV